MLDLISLIVTLIIMSLFGLGILMVLIIMSHENTEWETIQNNEDEIDFIKKWQKKTKRKERSKKKKIL